MSTLCIRPCRYMNISWRSPERATISVGVGTRTSVRYLLAKSEEVILGPRVCSLGGICLFISATSIYGTHISFARSDPIFATAFSTVSCGTGGPHSIVLRRRHVFFFLQTGGSWRLLCRVSRQHLLTSWLWSHFCNSHEIPNFFIIITVIVMVTGGRGDLWRHQGKTLRRQKGSHDGKHLLAIKYFLIEGCMFLT